MKQTILYLFALVFIYSCTPQDQGLVFGSFNDSRDDKQYKTITIGEQVWMAENLAYLPSVVGPATGSENDGHETDPYYYVYGYDGTNVDEAKATANYTIYGVLYNWKAALTVCPEGWHLPSDAEWTILISFLGGQGIASVKMQEAGTTHWRPPFPYDDYNSSGFTALPSGYRYTDGLFKDIRNRACWWSSTESEKDDYIDCAWIRYLLGSLQNTVFKGSSDKGGGMSVRCLHD
ncbi:MAG: FISUMP domain-containing protein [Anaerolineaceae bacterium]|nr:FISUMP domain-containing protein [Anaerolineaceae bacterium]